MSEIKTEDEVTSVGPEAVCIDPDQTLYVIFHGAIAFYDDPALPWIDAKVADLKDDHVYLCGKFMGELRIPAGCELALTGVTAGKSSFTGYENKFVHFTKGGARVHLDGTYCSLRFPRPEKIWHCYNFKSQKDTRQICIVPVFQYKFVDVTKVRLRMFLHYGHSCAADAGGQDQGAAQASRDDVFYWKPDYTDPTPTPLTLHVRAEEDRNESNAHRDFEATRRILGDTSADNRSDWNDHQYKFDERLPGIDDQRAFWEVYLSLWKRTRWLESVGSQIQRCAPAAGQDFTVTAPAPHKDDNPSCGPASGGADH